MNQFIASRLFPRYLCGDMKIDSNTRFRILIAVALLVGWFIVVFLRSGTAWG